SGFLEADLLTATGVSKTPSWDAATQLVSRGKSPTDPTYLPSTRIIFTSGAATGQGIPFQWGSLSGPDQAKFNDDPNLFAYLRGDYSHEADQPRGTFKIRGKTLLGAIVNSGVVIVGGPSADYDDSKFPPNSPEGVAAAAGAGYSVFRSTYANRQRT